MGAQKYLVRVVRPVFRATYLEVDAWNEKSAEGSCFLHAQHVPEEDWHGRYNPDEHALDLYCVWIHETSDGYPYSRLDFSQYSILSTEQNPSVVVEGFEPWMQDVVSPLLLASRLTEWMDQMIEARESYQQEAIERCEELLREWKGTDRKVVSLKPPEDRRDDIDLVETTLSCLRLLKEID